MGSLFIHLLCLHLFFYVEYLFDIVYYLRKGVKFQTIEEEDHVY